MRIFLPHFIHLTVLSAIFFLDPRQDILIHILTVYFIQYLMTVALIQMDRHIFYPGIFIFLIDSAHILSESPYRVIGSCRL